jgi:hypothetical protein
MSETESTIEEKILRAACQVLQLGKLVLVRSGEYLWVEHRSTGQQWSVVLPCAKTGGGFRFFKTK